MFYDRFRSLCEEKGVTCHRAALEIGLSNATPTTWKKRGLTPKAETLSKVAKYFSISVDELIEEEDEEKRSDGERVATNSIENGFYDRFSALCAERGVTHSRAAIDAGISKSLVTKWKSNKVQDPSAEVARKLSAYFGITVSELLGEEIKKAAPLSGSDLDARIIDVFSRLTAENQQRALDFLAGLLAAQEG